MVYSIAALNTDKQATLGKVTVTAVAHANTDSLDEAYQLTNHIETGWEENKKVKVVGMAKNHRSTSVGDILQDTNGAFHVVEPLFRFRKLSPEEIEGITFYTISKQEEAKLNG
jgi:hypothetical protein